MLKLTQETTTTGRTLVRVEGRLEGTGVQDLRGACAAAVGDLELSDLRSADAAGWELLKELKRSGWSVVRASLFVARVLEESAS